MRKSASNKRWEVPEHRGYPPTIPHTPTLTSASTPSLGGRGQALYNLFEIQIILLLFYEN